MSTNPTTRSVRVPLYEGVRCVTYLQGNDGEMRDGNFFDVLDEDFTEGNLTGVKLAYEIMAAARNGGFDAFDAVYEAALKVTQDAKLKPIRCRDATGAACGFLWAMGEILELAAKKLDLSELMARSFQDHEDMLQDRLSDTKDANAAFMATMKEAKAQVKAKKKSGAA